MEKQNFPCKDTQFKEGNEFGARPRITRKSIKDRIETALATRIMFRRLGAEDKADELMDAGDAIVTRMILTALYDPDNSVQAFRALVDAIRKTDTNIINVNASGVLDTEDDKKILADYVKNQLEKN